MYSGKVDAALESFKASFGCRGGGILPYRSLQTGTTVENFTQVAMLHDRAEGQEHRLERMEVHLQDQTVVMRGLQEVCGFIRLSLAKTSLIDRLRLGRI